MTSVVGGGAVAERLLSSFWVGRVASSLLDEAGLASRPVANAAAAWALVLEAAGCTEAELVARLAPAARVPAADLARPDSRLAVFVPEALALRHQVVPLRADQRTIWLATCDPLDFDAEQAVAFVTSRAVQLELAGPQALAEAHDAVYHPGRVVRRLIDGLETEQVEAVLEEVPATPDQPRDPVLDGPVAKLVDAIIGDAVSDGASDIHLEPLGDGVMVRYRIDGILKEVLKLPDSTGPSIVRRIKVVSRLDVTNSMRPQDGRMTVRIGGKPIDLRVSTMPVARRGEKVVVRILDKRHLKEGLAELGLAEAELQQLRRILTHREGLMLVTGPTGSGKTTTLYAALNELRTGRVNITTVEDPVEYDIPDIAQVQVNESQGLSFASALRSVLRQDPDVVLVGEIRDPETAEIAVQASMTGHLVLSTLHTNDAASAAPRMRDMGVDGFKLGTTLIGVVAQRLVRKLCEACAEPIAVEALPADCRPLDGRVATPRRAVGCEACLGLGYKGRMPILEIMIVDQTLGRLIEAGDSPLALLSVARRSGMRSLRESGLDRVWSGRTDLSEMLRVLGDRAEDAHETQPEPVFPPPVRERLAAAAPVIAPTARTEEAPAHVLVVDDDAQMRRFVRSVLEREQYLVSEAGDGLEALDQLQGGSVQLVLMDLDMPRLDGMATLEEIRADAATASLPVILLTARTEDEGSALDNGASDFLAKPLQPKALAARVRAVLRRAQM